MNGEISDEHVPLLLMMMVIAYATHMCKQPRRKVKSTGSPVQLNSSTGSETQEFESQHGYLTMHGESSNEHVPRLLIPSTVAANATQAATKKRPEDSGRASPAPSAAAAAARSYRDKEDRPWILDGAQLSTGM
jgi:hypothetical protein